MNLRPSLCAIALLLLPSCASSPASQAKEGGQPISLPVGDARQLKPTITAGSATDWISSNPAVAKVYANGFVIAMKPGDMKVSHGPAETYAVNVAEPSDKLADPAQFKQYPDNREFTDTRGRRCVGTELNAHLAGPERKQEIDQNRVEDSHPLVKKEPLMWEVQPDTPVFDGTGVLMGHVAPALQIEGGRKVPATKFNYGMSKIINGQFCVYAFAVGITPSDAIKPLLRPEAGQKQALDPNGIVGTSAWLPLEKVVKKEALLELVGIGYARLPRLPLETQRYVVTGGDSNQYLLPTGKELMIVPQSVAKSGPVPSHYLRRPSGTVNIEYSVPGFGLGGQNVDSVLITSHATFRPAKGVRQFVQPTYYPQGDPRVGQVADKTETFIYGALEAPNTQPVYGWIAREALAAE